MVSKEWFNDLYEKMKLHVDKLDNSTAKVGRESALKVLDHYKDDLKSLNQEKLLEFVSQLAIGNEQEAVNEFIRKSEAQDLIDGFMKDAALVIKEKKLEEEAKKKALQLVKDLTVAGAKHLLPLLLAAV